MKFANVLATAVAVVLPFSAFAQETAKATVVEAQPETGAELRRPSPKVLDAERRGYFQIGAGPAYGIGFASDTMMYNVQGSYNFSMNERFDGKALLDTYLATGSVSSRMINVGLGADAYLPEVNPFTTGLPYVTAQLALGNGRNAVEEQNSGLSLGGGAGFKVQAAELNLDISANYSILTAPIGNTYPSIIGARAAVNF